jgi:hypothetical protein
VPVERKLSTRALELLECPVAERLQHIDRPVFIPYPKAAALLDEMEDLLAHPVTNRMPGMLITSKPFNGKTEILLEFLKRHPAEDRREHDVVYAPVIYIQSPPGPNESMFFDKVLATLAVPTRPTDSAANKLAQVLSMLRQVQNRVLLVDELNALLAGSVTKQRLFLNTLKYISNDLRICIVAAGTPDAEQALRTDPQLLTRFPPRPLPVWSDDKAFRAMLASFELVLPLKEQSGLKNRELASKLYGLSGGILGELAQLIRSAAKQAITSGEEKITLDAINNCTYVKRRRGEKQ